MVYHIPYASIRSSNYLSWTNAPLYRSSSAYQSHVKSHQELEDYRVKMRPYKREEKEKPIIPFLKI